MVSALISRLVVLFVGTLYPAYGSYKAIRNKNAREYIYWIMYWICFALFTFFETFSDIFLAFWIPFYYEMKILFLAWLLCPATRGSAVLYKNFVHPQLVKHEQDIDEMIETAKQNGVSAMYQLGTRGAQYASQLLATTALKGQQVILKQIQRSYSQGDVTDHAALLGPGEEPMVYRRAASRNAINVRKLTRSVPAFSDEEDFQIIEEIDAATESAMDIEEEPPRPPTKKRGTGCSKIRTRRVCLEESSEFSEIDSSESVPSDVESVDSYAPPPPPAASSSFAKSYMLSRSYSAGTTAVPSPTSGTANRKQDDDDDDYDWKPMTRSKVQRKAAVTKKSPKHNANDNTRRVR